MTGIPQQRRNAQIRSARVIDGRARWSSLLEGSLLRHLFRAFPPVLKVAGDHREGASRDAREERANGLLCRVPSPLRHVVFLNVTPCRLVDPLVHRHAGQTAFCPLQLVESDLDSVQPRTVESRV